MDADPLFCLTALEYGGTSLRDPETHCFLFTCLLTPRRIRKEGTGGMACPSSARGRNATVWILNCSERWVPRVTM
uniref:Uncharacterized protein n=1 Tax=Faecalibaculum rodentium TaxID=1702221 RepID=A0A140DYC6_9FIRM|nr:hypothetical protein AALO17_25190 [Faecalibaculum rodentium]